MNRTAPVATDHSPKHLDTTVAIIGSGFSGLGMAIQLRRRGRDDFLILEKSHDIGGTWRDNTYPGCGCDVPTAIYSYSFEQNPFWSKLWSSQPEIHAYLRRLTDKYDLRRKTLFGTEIVAAHWDAPTSRWRLRSADGCTFTAQFLVIGAGPMTVPKIPNLKGIESFTGPAFHSARWDHRVDLTGKKVAVIGTGASAIQFVPSVAEQVGHLQLYQRTPPWVVGRFDPGIPTPLQRLFAKVPLIRNIFRAVNYWVSESLALGLHGYGNLHRPLEWAARANIRKSIKDPALAAKLTPNYQIGCKRLLFSRTYYPALARPNADVITDGIAEVRPGSIVTVDGTERAVDIIIYATGFNLGDALRGLDMRGADGESMAQRWNTAGPQAYMGITVAWAPNAFFLMGANTGIAHNSIVFMIEQQIKFALRAMDRMQQRAAASIRVRQDVQDRFNEDIQRRLAKRVWSTAACTNWFVDDKGVNRVLWPGFTWQYWRATRNFDETEYEFTRADHPAGSSKSAFTEFTDFFYERLRHKDAWSAAEAEPTTGFASLAGHKDALLLTYRADGEGVPSPVWFGRDEQDRVYFHTEQASGKVKRIRRNPEVRLAPCDHRGKPFGPPAMGIARILDPGESAHAERTIAANYGIGRTLYGCALRAYAGMSGRLGPYVYVEVQPKR